MRRTLYLVFAIAATFAQTTMSQDDGELRIRKALEGRLALVKMDMPAIDAGVYMFFDDANISFDQARYNKLVKEFGISVKKGTKAMITAVRISSKGIELDLDGGGSPDRDWVVGGVRLTEPAPVARSDREIELERRLQQESNLGVSSFLRNEFDYERDRRVRQDERNHEAFERANRLRSEYIEQNRKNWGSKLIVSVRTRKASVTLRDMLKSLSQYIEFLPRETATK
jgi:hypothetical protein